MACLSQIFILIVVVSFRNQENDEQGIIEFSNTWEPLEIAFLLFLKVVYNSNRKTIRFLIIGVKIILFIYALVLYILVSTVSRSSTSEL